LSFLRLQSAIFHPVKLDPAAPTTCQSKRLTNGHQVLTYEHASVYSPQLLEAGSSSTCVEWSERGLLTSQQFLEA
jgi:hypothetical protein